MKITKLLIALAIFLSQYAYAQTPDFTESFMTTWKTTTSGDSIFIPTKGGSDVTDYNFWIDWGDMTQPENVMGDDPNRPHTYATAGTFTVKITGTFPHFYLNNSSAIRDKLLSVEQWGNIAWESMDRMFNGASKLTLNATDTPVLSGVTDMTRMFYGAAVFNQDIGGWKVDSVRNMGLMFSEALAFNQDIGDWNVSKVTDMSSMFNAANAFNQDIGDWNVSSVTNMSSMFQGADAFNGDIGDWNVSKVTDMNFMFQSATAFNQDLSGWDVSSVGGMALMLNNSGLSTYYYEELLIAWNKLELQDNVALGAAGKQYRARAQTAHNSLRDTHGWTITDGGMKAENDAPVVVGFSDLILPQGFSNYKIPINSLFTDADGDPFTLSVTTSGMAIDATFANDMLTLTESGTGVDSIMMTAIDALGVQVADTFLVTLISFDSAFIISWKTTFANDTIGIPTTKPTDDPTVSSAYDFYVDWGDKSPVTRIMGFENGDSSHIYAVADTYEIKITGTYPAFRLAKNPKAANLVSVDQWGNIAWESMEEAFHDASNLMLKATDTPDFSGVTDMSNMFRGATFSGNMNHWNVSSVTNMQSVFYSTATFNQDIGDWNVSSVTDMGYMFGVARSFNQDLSSWDVSNVETMDFMFSNAVAFNQDISNWNVSMVADMTEMFNSASAFNQDISGWNVSKVTNMREMFDNASAFDQDISGWDVSMVTNMTKMLRNSGLSTYHYEELLIAWNELELQKDVVFGAAGKQYRVRAQTARASLMDIHKWMITDAGMKAENDVPIVVGFSDLVLSQGFPSHEIPINSLFTDGDGDPLTLSVVTGGDMAITATLGEDSLTLILAETGLGVDSIIMTATDGSSPQIADTFYVTVVSFDSAFTTTWKTTATDEVISIPTKGGSDVTDYDFWINWGDMTQPENVMGDDPNPRHTYATAGTFTVEITGTFPHFYLNGRTTIKDKLLSVEQWGNIAWESMANTFDGASNLTLNATDTPVLSGVTDMSSMFSNALAFNQDISGWDVSGVTDMSRMFSNATSFNQDIGAWNVSNVGSMVAMFNQATSFNQDIGEWKVDSVTTMEFMFNNAAVFNQDLSSWNVNSVMNMLSMFWNATAFNQDIGGWKVDSVTNMGLMFNSATAFNQNLSGWNVSKVTDMSEMFNNSGLSTYHYEELLIGWNKLNLQEDVPLGAAGIQYRMRAQTAHDSLTSMDIHSWMITDDSVKAENDAPTLTVPLPDLFFLESFGSFPIPINSLFTDGDGDPLTLSVTTDGDMVITAVLGEDSLTLTESGIGVASVMITARDVVGAQTVDTFLVTVTSFDSAFVTTWQTTTANDTITIPTKGGIDYDFWIDWGDNTPPEKTTGDDPNPSHTYTTVDTFTVKITGTFPHFYLNNNAEIRDKLLSVEQWGNIAWESMNSAFYGASNLTLNATETPDLSGVTSMSSMFRDATAFNQDIGDWNVSSVTDMSEMFRSAAAFNQDIGSWNVDSVTDMRFMFSGAAAFNQDIRGWSVSGVTDMRFMFSNAAAFDQDIGGWNVSGVTDMSSIFSFANAFNQNIGGWNVSGVTNMNTMFSSATAFNQDIGGWNVSGVTNMSNMFLAATAFNQDIGGWNVSGVTNMNSMLFDTDAFNQDISGWDVSMVTNMTNMLNLSGLSTYHYEELLIAWDTLTLQKGVPLGAAGKQYRARAQAAHDSLTSATNHNWMITDDGMKTQNDTPVVVGISDLSLLQGFASYKIPIDSLFTDSEGDILKLTFTTSGDMAIAATFENNALTLMEMGIGVDTLYLTANDIINEEVQVMDTFFVTVEENDPPRIANALADLTLEKGFATHEIDISNVFEDEQRLTLSVKVAMEGVLTAVISGDTLILTEVDTGATHVIITANDGALQVMDTFLVTIENVPPRIANALADLTLEKGFATHEIDISKVFEDEQPLTISVKVAKEGVLTAVISGDTLTLTEEGTGKTEVMLTASDGVLQTIDTFLVTVSETTDLITSVEVGKELVKLYPNPTAGTVSLDLGGVEKAWIKVYTLQGSILFEKVLLENTYNVELPGSAGIYLVEIITMDNRQIIKLVRE